MKAEPALSCGGGGGGPVGRRREGTGRARRCVGGCGGTRGCDGGVAGSSLPLRSDVFAGQLCLLGGTSLTIHSVHFGTCLLSASRVLFTHEHGATGTEKKSVLHGPHRIRERAVLQRAGAGEQHT